MDHQFDTKCLAPSVTRRAALKKFRLAGMALAAGCFLVCPAQAGVFRATDPLTTARGWHTATLLANGNVLVAGGEGTNGTAELYDPTAGMWTSTGGLNTNRDSHTATLLPNGKVLVVGGALSIPGFGWAGTLASAELYDPASGTWAVTGSLNLSRWGHSATLLPNGKVLVTGGEYDDRTNYFSLNQAELYDPDTGLWTLTGVMQDARQWHTATLLGNGRILVAGGMSDTAGFLNRAELYDPVTGIWTPTGELENQRQSHTATLLPNGLVLVAGGFECCGGFGNYIPLASAELYNPQTGTWRATTNLLTARAVHTANLLSNGRVLVAGGLEPGFFGFPTPTAEEYDPTKEVWSSTGELADSRESHTATLLGDGRVLVAGGSDFAGVLQEAELYDSGSGGTWEPTGSLLISRTYQTIALLTNGQVLIAGGRYNGTNMSEVERFNPATGRWTATNPMGKARVQHSATLLSNGRLLVAGGSLLADAELYDTATGQWTPTGALNLGRSAHSATRLQNGQVLVAGGYIGFDVPDSELYDPGTGIWSWTASLNIARSLHTATLLPSGQVLVAGGYYGGALLPDAELYDPDSGTWTSVLPMTDARMGHTATLLPNGKVLVAGGYRTYTSSGIQASVELFDPATSNWTATASMSTPRANHIAVLLTNGLVLVAGGQSPSSTPGLSSAELYDPSSGTWSPVARMTTPRFSHSATLLVNGQVLAIGGQSQFSSVASTELYDPGAAHGPLPPAPRITGTKRLANGSLQFAFTNTPNALFHVLATPFPTLPANDWLVLSGITEISPGQFQFTDNQATNFAKRFYQLRSR